MGLTGLRCQVRTEDSQLTLHGTFRPIPVLLFLSQLRVPPNPRVDLEEVLLQPKMFRQRVLRWSTGRQDVLRPTQPCVEPQTRVVECHYPVVAKPLDIPSPVTVPSPSVDRLPDSVPFLGPRSLNGRVPTHPDDGLHPRVTSEGFTPSGSRCTDDWTPSLGLENPGVVGGRVRRSDGTRGPWVTYGPGPIQGVDSVVRVLRPK